MTEQPLTN